MIGHNGKADPIDQAIEATAQVPGLRVEFELVTGRPCVLTVPQGMTDSEWLSLIANLIPLRDQMRAVAQAQTNLVVARALPGKPS